MGCVFRYVYSLSGYLASSLKQDNKSVALQAGLRGLQNWTPCISDSHRNRSKNFWGGGGWGLGYLSLSDRLEWQVGRVIYFLAFGRGNFFLPHVSILEMPVFSKRNQTQKKFRLPDLTSKSALGYWPIHLSPVTCHSRGGGGGTAMRCIVAYSDSH